MQYVLAVYKGVVREVYEVAQWFAAGATQYFTREVFPSAPDEPKPRSEFVGRIAPDKVRRRYLLKSVQHLFTPGSRNPFQYVNC